MIFYGTKGGKINQEQISGTTCKNCEQTASQNITSFGKYAHIYWIPFFPVKKLVVAECTNCKKTIEKNQFSPQLRDRFDEVSGNHKTPIWYWSGLGTIGAIIAFFYVSSIFGPEEIPDYRKDLFEADMNTMVTNPDSTMSKASLLHTFLKIGVESPMDFDKIEYLHKTENDKELFLMKFPEFKSFKSEDRETIFDMVISIVDSDSDSLNTGLDKYIGIHGKYNLMAVKTPTTKEVSRIVSEKLIYDFYGEAPQPPKEE